jgi:hypothetical protein
VSLHTHQEELRAQCDAHFSESGRSSEQFLTLELPGRGAANYQVSGRSFEMAGGESLLLLAMQEAVAGGTDGRGP